MTLPTSGSLARQLGAVIGRGTVIGQEAGHQLTGSQGTLSTQLCVLLDRTLAEVRGLLNVQADLPPRRPHGWTLLTEFENAAWPMLALSDPPALSTLETARLARHLAVSYAAMNQANARRWARKKEATDGTETLLGALGQPLTWAALLAAVTTAQLQLILLPGWGVLAAYVGLEQRPRLEAARLLLRRLTERPELVEEPARFAAEALWASLWLLHGGLPAPDAAQVSRLALDLRTLPERTVRAALPGPHELQAQLAGLLPELTPAACQELGERLRGHRPTDPNAIMTGLAASRHPGQMAYWLRRASEVQLIVCRSPGPGEALNVYAWRWQLH